MKRREEVLLLENSGMHICIEIYAIYILLSINICVTAELINLLYYFSCLLREYIWHSKLIMKFYSIHKDTTNASLFCKTLKTRSFYMGDGMSYDATLEY